MKTEWIDRFDKLEFSSPIQIKKDYDYESCLRKIIQDFLCVMKQSNIDDNLWKDVEDCSNRIINALKCTYKGQIIKAQSHINEVIRKLDYGDNFAICDVNLHPGLWGVESSKIKEVQFFRARVGESYCEYSKGDMFHVPFYRRGFADTTRFSILGLPCLYLSNSTYGCWIELGKPPKHEFTVSPVLIEGDVKVLNLAVSIFDLERFKDENRFQTEDEREMEFVKYVKLMMLSLASSFVVEEKGRKFKSEYVISQMIMIGAMSNGIDGVVYYSKKVSNENFALVAVNVALFPSINDESDYSKILSNKILIGSSFNMAKYGFLTYNKQNVRYKNLCINNNGREEKIGQIDRQYNYKDTEFYRFDNYIFNEWKSREHPIG